MTSYITKASFDLIAFKNGRTIFERILHYIKHKRKCTTYFNNLVYSHQGKKHSIHADRVCYVCGKIEKNLLIYQRIDGV